MYPAPLRDLYFVNSPTLFSNLLHSLRNKVDEAGGEVCAYFRTIFIYDVIFDDISVQQRVSADFMGLHPATTCDTFLIDGPYKHGDGTLATSLVSWAMLRARTTKQQLPRSSYS